MRVYHGAPSKLAAPRPSLSAALLEFVAERYEVHVDQPRDLGGSFNLNLLVDGHVVRVYGPWVSVASMIRSTRSASNVLLLTYGCAATPEARRLPMPGTDQPHSYWKPGDAVVLRGVWRGRLWWAAPVTVVRDDPDVIALYWPAGTLEKLPAERVTPRQLLSAEQLKLVEREWVDTDVLMLATPGSAHAVYAMWEEGHASFRCWYVDLQEPLRRTSLGFDTMDHLLDIVVSPDRSEWRWKDEDEFEEAVAIGVFSPEEAGAIRAEGERVIGLLKADESPFCDGWERWSPPPQWEIPSLPKGWDAIATQSGSPCRRLARGRRQTPA